MTSLEASKTEEIREKLSYTKKDKPKRATAKKAASRKITSKPKPKPPPAEPKSCLSHPKYTGARKPRTDCKKCMGFYLAKKELK